MLALLFILFAALAVGCALAVVAQRNPLYSAISLIGRADDATYDRHDGLSRGALERS